MSATRHCGRLACSTLLCLTLLPACSTTDDDGDTGAGGVDAGTAEPSVWQHEIFSVVEQPASAWHVTLEGTEVVARHTAADLALLIDATSGTTDERYAGIYLTEAGTARFTGRYNATTCSTFVPDRPYLDQEAVEVLADDATLTVTMTEGSLAEIPDSQFESDEPFRWQSSWSLEGDGLHVAAQGLYYLLPSKDSCQLTLRAEDGAELGSLALTLDTEPFLQYFEAVRSIEVVSAAESFAVTTDAEILQVEIPSYPDTGLFELDFDHSFKERGQSDVHCESVLPVGG